MSVTPDKDPNYIYAHPYATLIADEYRMRGGYCIVRPGGTDDHLMLLTRAGRGLFRTPRGSAAPTACRRARLQSVDSLWRRGFQPRLARSVGSSANHAKQIGRTSPALGRPTPIHPFLNPDMDGINRHSTTSQPSFVSNP